MSDTCSHCLQQLKVVHNGPVRDATDERPSPTSAPTMVCLRCDAPRAQDTPEHHGLKRHRNSVMPDHPTWDDANILKARRAWGIPDPEEQDQS